MNCCNIERSSQLEKCVIFRSSRGRDDVGCRTEYANPLKKIEVDMMSDCEYMNKYNETKLGSNALNRMNWTCIFSMVMNDPAIRIIFFHCPNSNCWRRTRGHHTPNCFFWAVRKEFCQLWRISYSKFPRSLFWLKQDGIRDSCADKILFPLRIWLYTVHQVQNLPINGTIFTLRSMHHLVPSLDNIMKHEYSYSPVNKL